MAVVSISLFGGMLPSANPQLIDSNRAVFASDVDVRYQDFRPAITPASVTTATAGATLYKFSGSSTFLTNTNDVNYVRGPIPNDTTERTYYTGDGVPKVTDLTLAVRQLGVPKPSTAPVATVVKNVSFTTADAENAKKWAPSYIFTAVKTNAIQGVYSGMADADLTDLSSTSRPWEYSVVRSGTLSGSVFTPSITSDVCLLSPSLEYVTDTTTIKVPLFVRGRKYVADNTTLTTVLTNIPSPDPTKPTEKMLSSDQVTKLAAGIQACLVSRDSEVADIIAKVKALKISFMALLNSPGNATNLQAGANALIYSSAAGVTAIDNAVTGLANQVLQYISDNSGDSSTTLSAAKTAISGYIVTASNGIKSVDAQGLYSWIFAKIKSTAMVVKYDNVAMQSEARMLANQFSGTINDIPSQLLGANAATNGIYELVTKALAEKQAQMESYIKQMEATYQAVIDERLQDAITNLFDANVASTFPTGTPQVITQRAYVETYVTDWGEESQPGTVSNIVEVDQNDNSTVALGTVPSGRNITKRRLYRSATGSSASAFLFQGEYSAATTNVTDTIPDTQLGEACPTFGWAEPPSTLSGLVSMPNGILLGFDGSTLHACEPYAPYAWPAKYDIPLDFPIVGIAVAGQTAVVTTKGVPYLVSGVDSANLSAEKMPVNQACVSKRSMVAIGGSVIYASPDGLVIVENGTVNLITYGLLSKADWNAYNPSSIVAAEYEGRYCAFFTKSGGTKGCLVFDFSSKALYEMSTGCDAVFSDKATDTLYTLVGTTIYNYFPTTGSYKTGVWKSKKFNLAAQSPLAWLFVDAAFGTVNIDIRCDGSAFYNANVISLSPVRIPAGRFKEWQITITSSVPVTRVTLASSTSELKQVL